MTVSAFLAGFSKGMVSESAGKQHPHGWPAGFDSKFESKLHSHPVQQCTRFWQTAILLKQPPTNMPTHRGTDKHSPRSDAPVTEPVFRQRVSLGHHQSNANQDWRYETRSEHQDTMPRQMTVGTVLVSRRGRTLCCL